MSKVKSRSHTSSQSDRSADDSSSTPSNPGSKKDDSMDDANSQDDIKSESGNNASSTGMSLRDRSKRARPNYKYLPEPEITSTTERRVAPKSERTVSSSMNAEVSHWLQCDSCHKWRIVAHKLFEDLKKLTRFECRNLQGVTCKDRDDWASAGASDDTSVKDEGSQRRRSRKQIKRINIFSGKYIPGFAGEFSDFGDE